MLKGVKSNKTVGEIHSVKVCIRQIDGPLHLYMGLSDKAWFYEIAHCANYITK